MIGPEPEHKIGDVVTMDSGWEREVLHTVTISGVSANHGGRGEHRYWGTDERGQLCGFYESQIGKRHTRSLEMRKKDELSREHTCMNHAHDEEMVFVLLSRDAASPVAVRAWVAERLRLGKNVETDEQIVSALACARTMELEGAKWKNAAAQVAHPGVGPGLSPPPIAQAELTLDSYQQASSGGLPLADAERIYKEDLGY